MSEEVRRGIGVEDITAHVDPLKGDIWLHSESWPYSSDILNEMHSNLFMLQSLISASWNDELKNSIDFEYLKIDNINYEIAEFLDRVSKLVIISLRDTRINKWLEIFEKNEWKILSKSFLLGTLSIEEKDFSRYIFVLRDEIKEGKIIWVAKGEGWVFWDILEVERILEEIKENKTKAGLETKVNKLKETVPDKNRDKLFNYFLEKRSEEKGVFISKDDILSELNITDYILKKFLGTLNISIRDYNREQNFRINPKTSEFEWNKALSYTVVNTEEKWFFFGTNESINARTSSKLASKPQLTGMPEVKKTTRKVPVQAVDASVLSTLKWNQRDQFNISSIDFTKDIWYEYSLENTSIAWITFTNDEFCFIYLLCVNNLQLEFSDLNKHLNLGKNTDLRTFVLMLKASVNNKLPNKTEVVLTWSEISLVWEASIKMKEKQLGNWKKSKSPNISQSKETKTTKLEGRINFLENNRGRLIEFSEFAQEWSLSEASVRWTIRTIIADSLPEWMKWELVKKKWYVFWTQEKIFKIQKENTRLLTKANAIARKSPKKRITWWSRWFASTVSRVARPEAHVYDPRNKPKRVFKETNREEWRLGTIWSYDIVNKWSNVISFGNIELEFDSKKFEFLCLVIWNAWIWSTTSKTFLEKKKWIFPSGYDISINREFTSANIDLKIVSTGPFEDYTIKPGI